MMLSSIRSKIEARRAAAIKIAVSEYLDHLPAERAAAIIPRIIGAAGLTESTFTQLFKLAGDKVIDIHFAGGDTATISRRSIEKTGGPGW